jgi:sugar lactone lactonase YvrE
MSIDPPSDPPSVTPQHVVCLRPLRVAFMSGLIATGLLFAAACNSSSSTSTGVGDIIVVVNVPTGGSGDVNVAGPSGYSQNLTATGTLATIATGQYVITAKPARVGDPIVSQVDTGVAFYDVTGDSGTTLTVTLNNNAIDTIVVNYAPRPASGFLFTTSQTSNALNRINGYYSVQLQDLPSAGSPSATVSVDGRPGQGVPGPIAIDPTGNVWVATQSNQISEYLYGQFTLGTTTGPTGTQFTVIAAPTSIAFDAAGDLYVAVPGEIVEYPSAGLSGGMSGDTLIIPQLTAGPAGIAFDNTGNLWVAASASGALIELTTQRLAGSGGTADSNIVALTGTSVVAPAFDPSGRLWVVTTSNTILGYSASQTETFTSATTPSLTVTVNSTGTPSAAAFDNSQDIWIAEGSSVAELTFAELTAGGSQTPTATLTPCCSLANTTGLAFNPKGQFLPLAGAHTTPPPSVQSKIRLLFRPGT